MLHDPQKIKKDTGYYPGNVYIYDEVKAEKNERFESPDRHEIDFYDENTGNFHVVPEDNVFNNTYLIGLVKEARSRIIEGLKKDERISTNESEKNNKPLLLEGKGSSPKKPLNIEKWVQVEWNRYTYLLCFERLYTDKDTVNCMFGLFQFYKYSGKGVNKYSKSVNKYGKKFSMCYPESFKDKDKKELKNGECIVCNPELPSAFELNDNNIKTVCDTFINFIKNN